MGAGCNKENSSGGRHRAPQKLQAGGGYGTIGQKTDRIQPAAKRWALLNTHRREEDSYVYPWREELL